MSTPTTQRVGEADPFNITPTSTTRDRTKSLRHSQIDSNLLASFARGSPSQAKRALEAHIADTDRRIQDASRLGTTLVDQKKQLAERLKDLDAQQDNGEIHTDLKQKLSELEREYNEVGKETARAFIPRGNRNSSDFRSEADRTPLADKGANANNSVSGRPASPEKLGKGTNRKSRNQPQNRVHDIEFATEISTSLLGQVRGLQNLLAEREEALKQAQNDNAELQNNFESLSQRMRGLDDDDQKYKDENWALETQVQDLTALIKDSAAREEKLQQSVNAMKSEKSTAEKEYEELRSQHNKLTDQHSALQKNHDIHVTDSKRSLEDGQTEKEEMQKRIDELYSQNHDLAQAVAYRAKNEQANGERDVQEDDIVESVELDTPENSPPVSPTKATPRHPGLESETLKSSLTHAHRMIQTLKNNMHREKTEKIELKRLLQDARDEIEQSKVGGGAAAANAGRKRKPAPGQEGLTKQFQASKLGGARDMSEWEEYDDGPTRPAPLVHETDLTTDASDAFETADEKGLDSQTDTDAAFESAADTMAGSTDEELTETEDNSTSTIPGRRSNAPSNHRDSFLSTASDEGDELDPTTPLRQPKYKLRLGRPSLRNSATPMRDSPASFASNSSLPRSGSHNLAAELEGMDSPGGSSTTSRANTIDRELGSIAGTPKTPDLSRQDTVRASASPTRFRLPYVDSGMMTEPWEPEPRIVIKEVAKEVTSENTSNTATLTQGGTPITSTREASTQSTPKKVVSQVPLQISPIMTQSITSVDPPKPVSAVSSNGGLIVKTPGMEQVANEDFDLPDVPSISRENKLAPSTQQFLNEILAQAREKRAEVARSRAATASAVTESSTPIREARKADAQDGVKGHGSNPSFEISIPGRELTPQHPAGPTTPEGQRIIEPRLSIQESVKKEDGTFKEPTLSLDDQPRTPIQYDLGLSPSFPRNAASNSIPAAQPRSANMVTQGTQTSLSSETIEGLVQESRRQSIPNSPSAPSVTKPTPIAARAMSMGSSTDPNLLKTLNKRPTSSGSISSKNRASSPPPNPEVPPLPANHRAVIAEAKDRSSSLMSMPPPNFPVGKLSQARDRTSSGTFNQSPMRSGVVGSARNRTSSLAARSEISRRSSVSSFASEIDESFNNIRSSGYGFPEIPGAGDNADPRMIQAITQTMIGEFLWKYTRKAGRGDSHSENRHRRFFWIHPYTRTLYWSNQDPSVSGRTELKAKSVAIEAVRVISDENPIPPGLSNKSIVIVTPGRSIKFTAPTQRRHETWFNALSYLLLRSSEPSNDDPTAKSNSYTNTSSSLNAPRDRSSTMGSGITADDVAEFNPSNYSRTASRISHRSISSIQTSGRKSAAQGSFRTSSPQGRSPLGGAANSLAVRQSQAAARRDQGKVSSTINPLSANPVQPIPESEASRRGSIPQDGLDSPTTALPSRSEPKTQNGDSEVDADGFKKPKARPLSTTTAQSNRDSAKAPEPNSSDAKREGRLSGLTNRISRASFASLGRGRRQTRSEVEPPSPSKTVASTGTGTSTGDGHEHQYVFRRNKDGTLENVRACCDGKHDLSSLRHRSESRTSLGRRRSQSAKGDGKKRMSFSSRVAPRPVGGA